MSTANVIDPFVSNGAEVEVDDATSQLLTNRVETAATGKLVSASEARIQVRQWLSESSTTKMR